MGRAAALVVCISVATAFVLACGSNDTNLLLNGRGGDGTRYNNKLPEPPATREDDGVELGPDTSDAGAGAGSGVSDVVSYCISEINRYRATLGAAALPAWSEAETCTENQCRNDAASKQAHGSFGNCTELGQNECPGWGGWHGDPKVVIHDCLEMMWAEGPGGGHYENMRKASWRKVSCGLYTAPNGEVTAIQNFR